MTAQLGQMCPNPKYLIVRYVGQESVGTVCLETRGPVRVGEAETFRDTLRLASAVHRERDPNSPCAKGAPESMEAPSCP